MSSLCRLQVTLASADQCLMLLCADVLLCAGVWVRRWLQLAKDDADTLPGHSPAHRHLITATFEAMSKESGGKISK